MKSYRARMAAAPAALDKIAAARALYREDVAAGHVTVIAELLAASLARPELRAPLLERMRPWLDLVTETFREMGGSSPLAQLVPLEDVAPSFVALYLGLNLLSRLDPESTQADSLFDLLERVAPFLEPG
jgi:hypothetical protein